MEEIYASKPLNDLGGKTRLNGLRILLVDDSDDNLNLFSRILTTAGARVELAHDGWEAIEKQKGQRFDTIIMDVRMPDIDGYETTRRIRANGFRGPMIALTAHALPGEEERCRAAGCSHFHLKPIDRNSLVAAVEAAACVHH
ncbi:MAG TPA: response regulator [Bdellovibrionales bacterium]|nr:response regulator [Bdellovibrionales bacterium]